MSEGNKGYEPLEGYFQTRLGTFRVVWPQPVGMFSNRMARKGLSQNITFEIRPESRGGLNFVGNIIKLLVKKWVCVTRSELYKNTLM